MSSSSLWRSQVVLPAVSIGLRGRLQFANEPANISRLHRIQHNDDFYNMIAFGTVERAKFQSCRPRRDARQPHASLTFREANSLNCKQRDCGWIIGHSPRPQIRGAQNSQSAVDAED